MFDRMTARLSHGSNCNQGVVERSKWQVKHETGGQGRRTGERFWKTLLTHEYGFTKKSIRQASFICAGSPNHPSMLLVSSLVNPNSDNFLPNFSRPSRRGLRSAVSDIEFVPDHEDEGWKRGRSNFSTLAPTRRAKFGA